MTQAIPNSRPFIEEFWRGFRAELPLLLGVMPFGMIYGVLALTAGINPAQAQAMSALVFAGSSQFIATQLIAVNAPIYLTIFTILVVNLRHILYSASIAPYLQHLPPIWKVFLPYLLTDEAYAVTIAEFQKHSEVSPTAAHGFFLGAGLTLWGSWQASTAIGVFLGTVVPQNWSLDFTLALTFIAIVVPTLKDRAIVTAAVVASLVAVLAVGLPYKLSLIVAAFCALLAGYFIGER